MKVFMAALQSGLSIPGTDIAGKESLSEKTIKGLKMVHVGQILFCRHGSKTFAIPMTNCKFVLYEDGTKVPGLDYDITPEPKTNRKEAHA